MPALAGEQADAGAGDHQFADEVDQAVELVGLDADQARFGGLLLADLLLAADCGFDQLGLHDLLFDEDLADLRAGFVFNAFGRGLALGVRFGAVLCGQPLVELDLGQCTDADEDLAQSHRVLGQAGDQRDVIGQAAVRRQDLQAAVVANEVEHPLDGGLVRVRGEADLEAQIAGLGVHRRGLRASRR
ncbi:hypothetical protein MASR2M50_07070 [Thauera sp.]